MFRKTAMVEPLPSSYAITVPADAPTPTEPLPERTKVDTSMVVLDGVYHLAIGPDRTIPFSQAGAPLRSVGAGWRFHSLHTLFAPLFLMELESDAGHRAIWYFDSMARYVGNAVSDLDPTFRVVLVRRTTEVMAAVLSPCPTPGADQLVAEFFRIEEATRLQIVATYAAVFCPPVRVAVLAELSAPLAVLSSAGPVTIAPGHVGSALAVDFQARLLDAARDGQLTWPGLVDGSPLPCTASLCLSDFLFAYRFEEPGSRLTFLVITTMHKAVCMGVFLPSENLLIMRDEATRAQLGPSGSNISHAIADFAGRYGNTFVQYLRKSGAKPMACSMRERHIGHQVWNELSGLENLAATVPPDSLPVLLPFGGDASAVFGAFDSLFPEFAGKSHPELQSARDIVEFAHRQGLVMARFTDDFVGVGLRERILHAVRQTEEFGIVAERRRRRPGPVIIIGLRVENRTAVDLPGFLTALVRCIAAELPDAIVVLDGQNGSPSFASERASRSPAEFEADLCRQVQAAFDPAEITIEIASGHPVATSIAWSNLASGFIGFWGAGLAKYRWVANKPGLVISNRDNLRVRPDLHIYDDPAYMSDPAPMTFVDPSIVIDDPGAVQLIALPDPSFANFHVEEAAFAAEVRGFLAQWRDGPTVAAHGAASLAPPAA